MLTVIVRGMVACALLGFGSCAYTSFTGLYTLDCARAAGACLLKRDTRLASSVRIPVAELVGAEVEDYRTAYPNAPGSRSSKSARLVILTRGGRVPLMDHFSGIGMDEMAAQRAAVELFVKQPSRPGLHIERDDRRMALLAGGVPFLLGLGVLASAVVEYRRWWHA
jgi:hypothetical protein